MQGELDDLRDLPVGESERQCGKLSAEVARSECWAPVLDTMQARLLDGPAARAEVLGLVNTSIASSARGSRDCHGAPDGKAGTDHADGAEIAMNSCTSL